MGEIQRFPSTGIHLRVGEIKDSLPQIRLFDSSRWVKSEDSLPHIRLSHRGLTMSTVKILGDKKLCPSKSEIDHLGDNGNCPSKLKFYHLGDNRNCPSKLSKKKEKGMCPTLRMQKI